MATIVLLITTGLLIGYGIWELYRHRQKLAKIPIRVHVNGTRGKSSVARLIAAGLRASGMRTCCKTTGTLPRMIVPSGTEYPVFRPSKANVIEQVRIVDMAVEFEAEALVIECMALRPNLQWLCENKLVRATHGVITNAREDHLDVMGPTEKDVAWALAGMVPVKTKLFTAERDHLDVFAHASKDRGTQLIAITEQDVEQITPLDLAGFMYVEHAENVALALRVCADLGVDRATALRGMWEAKPDPGAMTAHEMDFFGRKIHFVNGFAANDPESTERIWKMALERYPEVERRVMVVNCRQDRPDRSQQLGQSVTKWPPADFYVLIGTGTYIFAKTATEAGIDPLKLVFAEDLPAPDIFETLLEYSGKTSLIMGIANIGGVGLDVVRYFANRSTQKTFK
ncbi:poly-gamma-glutamate synthase PgsB [Blastopirellula marina]|uniref:Poly-gamma-glutamate synthase PgsB n=1 Tax=Blastopirellula marina TaxID=124 RepID=A0A2S8FXA0_9BACT|nr:MULTISPECIES: poly-gamma-glutamate synthase PgsB [Pirellulaceae]PQO36807.1 poly-gamma-glutamate synthase PgsB [Blastopirellula marina]RCS53522.1 poly-gamma-glutamate synthase PgsB [Bremerella cremea]